MKVKFKDGDKRYTDAIYFREHPTVDDSLEIIVNSVGLFEPDEIIEITEGSENSYIHEIFFNDKTMKSINIRFEENVKDFRANLKDEIAQKKATDDFLSNLQQANVVNKVSSWIHISAANYFVNNDKNNAKNELLKIKKTLVDAMDDKINSDFDKKTFELLIQLIDFVLSK